MSRLDRFGRRWDEILDLVDALDIAGGLLIIGDQPSNGAWRFEVQIRAMVEREERTIRSDRMKAVAARRKAQQPPH